MRYLFAPIVASLLYIMPSDASAKVADSDTLHSTPVVVAPAPAARVASSVTEKAADDRSDKARYAAREADSTKAQNYRGGDTLVIGSTAAVAILAVILIIVLI